MKQALGLIDTFSPRRAACPSAPSRGPEPGPGTPSPRHSVASAGLQTSPNLRGGGLPGPSYPSSPCRPPQGATLGRALSTDTTAGTGEPPAAGCGVSWQPHAPSDGPCTSMCASHMSRRLVATLRRPLARSPPPFFPFAEACLSCSRQAPHPTEARIRPWGRLYSAPRHMRCVGGQI